jgi:hypothetical protein
MEDRQQMALTTAGLPSCPQKGISVIISTTTWVVQPFNEEKQPIIVVSVTNAHNLSDPNAQVGSSGRFKREQGKPRGYGSSEASMEAKRRVPRRRLVFYEAKASRAPELHELLLKNLGNLCSFDHSSCIESTPRGEAAYAEGGANAPTAKTKLSANNLKLQHVHPLSQGSMHRPWNTGSVKEF